MSYGLLPEGFETKPLAAILADIEAAELAGISPSLDVQPTALLGILNGVMAAAISETWELLAALYNGMDPDGAVDDQLTSLSLITGTLRDDATKTQVTVTLDLDGSFSAAIGTMFASLDGAPDTLFTNKELVATTPPNASYSALFQAVDTGPIQCLAGTLTVISQPLSGWNSVTNAADGTPGTDIENNAALRTRRVTELARAGSATAEAIRADIMEALPGNTSVTVLYNDTDTTDGNGLPGHSIEVIAYQAGATSQNNQDLAEQILDSKAAGIGTYSGNSTSKTVTDSQGNDQTVYYTRPTAVPIYVDITVVTDDTYPVDGDAQVKAALAAYALATYQPGSDVYALRLRSEGFKVQGVLDITVFELARTASPSTTANLVMTIRELATLSTSNITVTS